mgnify:CR=1 FL=1
MGLIGFWQQQVRNPPADQNETVRKRSENLSDIDQDTASGLGLPVSVIIPMAWFLIHQLTPFAFQAGFRFCSSNAAAASCPRPPLCNRST